MRALVTLSQRFVSCDGRLFAPACAYEAFGQRYLTEFDRVVILARVAEVDRIDDSFVEATGPGVSFIPFPDYHGPWQYLAKLPELRRITRRAVGEMDAFILRLPCHVGSLAWNEIGKRGWPYAAEIVADPWLSLAPGSVKSIVRPFVRRSAVRRLRQQCQEASATAYVTNEYLQRFYPPHTGRFTTSYSSVELPDDAVIGDLTERENRIQSLPDRLNSGGPPVRLGFIGTFDTMYKAPDILIRAVAKCRQRGGNVELVMVGDGQYRPDMEQLARREGVTEAVRFVGRLQPGEPIFRFLDDVDLFLLASRAEALPRVLIEAMARGCPAIGSNVGAIPELLPSTCLVTPGDADALAARIEFLLRNNELCHQLAEQNRDRARDYSLAVLNARRRVFYRFVRDQTAVARGLSEPHALRPLSPVVS